MTDPKKSEHTAGDEHPMDEPLGDIHISALQLEANGHTDIALRLTKAHEAIQNYLVEDRATELLAEMPSSVPDLLAENQRLRSALEGMPCTCHCDVHDSDWCQNPRYDKMCLFKKREIIPLELCSRVWCPRCIALGLDRKDT